MTSSAEQMEVDQKELTPMETDEYNIKVVDRAEIVQIAKETTGQCINPKWFAYRRNRITGSMFGSVINAVDYPTTNKIHRIKQSLNGEINLDYLEPIKWGKNNEQRAIESYCRLTCRTVKQTGIWLFPSGELGASPDGLVYERSNDTQPSGIIEVKCPYNVRNMHYAEMQQNKCLPPYITPTLQLNTAHNYYHQVQGELFATEAPWCDFVMWTTSSTLIRRVLPNPQWAHDNIPKLKSFYKALQEKK